MAKISSYGLHRKVLDINLTDRIVSDYPVSEETYRKFVGGRGLGVKLLFEELPVNADPLGEENIIVITTGPLVGSPFFAIKHVVNTKSPLTGNYLDTYGGGHFASELRYAGYDALLIRGKADELVYLWINDDEVEIRDARFLKGNSIFSTEDKLKELNDDKTVRVVSIGPAGENMVKFANLMNDYHHACGRGGAGAVFGSKNLKAIAAKGTKGLEFADPDYIIKFVQEEVEERIKQRSFIFNNIKYGKAYTMEHTQKVGMLPTRNFKYTQYEDYKYISAHHIRENVVVGDKGCFACNMPCGHFSKASKSGKYAGAKVIGPHYEANCLLGSNLMNNDIDAVIKGNEMCNEMGMDYMSAANAIGYAIECFENGYITTEDTGGVTLRFGDNDSVHKMIEKIVKREDIGDLLAEGVKKASMEIGKGSERFAMQGKGFELPAYDPRGVPGLALAYTIADRGACHRRMAPFNVEPYHENIDIEEQGDKVKELYDERVPMHCASICDTTGGLVSKLTSQDFANLFSAAVGWDMNKEEVDKLCDRVATLCLLFNLREGAPFTKEDNLNTFPARLTEEEVPEGPSKGRKVNKDELNLMLTRYYELRGWNPETGIPGYKKVEELSLEEEFEKLKNIDRLRGVIN